MTEATTREMATPAEAAPTALEAEAMAWARAMFMAFWRVEQQQAAEQPPAAA